MSDDLLDDILNDALDELEEPSSVQSALSTAAQTTSKAQELSAREAALNAPQQGGGDVFADMIKAFGGEDFEKVLDEAFKDLDLNDIMQKLQSGEGLEGLMGGAGGGGAAPSGDAPALTGENMEAELANLMKMLQAESTGAAAAAGGSPLGPTAGAGPNLDVMEKLVAKLESELGEDGINSFMENMMKKMMSKEVMYKPIKSATEEYPRFLSQKGIPAADRVRYEKQFAGYKALLQTFDEDPDNFARISQIMSDLNAYGQPPDEITKLITPPDMPGGRMPGMPGMLPGMDGAGGPGGQPQCPTQ